MQNTVERVRASLEPGCQIAQVVTVDVDRWAMAWAATTAVPAGEFSPPARALFSPLISFLLYPPSFPRQRKATRRAVLSFIPASPHSFLLQPLHWHVVFPPSSALPLPFAPLSLPANFITSPLFFVLSPVVFRRISHRRDGAIPGAAHEVSTARVCQSFKPPPPSLEYLLLTLRTVLE